MSGKCLVLAKITNFIRLLIFEKVDGCLFLQKTDRMAKRKVEIELYSYGEYAEWDRQSKSIPRLVAITETVGAEIGTEFGYVLKIRHGKGKKLDFRIDHPSFPDKEGKVAPPFTGEQYIRSNDYEFFLGDCIWEPLEDKLGNWTMTTWLDGKIVAQKTLRLVAK